MTSRLTTRDFKSRLTELTRPGKPWVMGTPLGFFYFNQGEEPFLGEIENSNFRLTNNSTFFSTGTIIEGSFNEELAETKVVYEIKTMRFPYFWSRFIPLLGLIVFNAVIIVSANASKFRLVLATTVFFALAFLYARWLERRRLKRLEKKFNDELKLTDINR